MQVRAKSISRVRLFATLWTVACRAPLSMGFSRQEYWSGLPFLSPGDLPDPGMQTGSLMSPELASSLPLVPPGKPNICTDVHIYVHTEYIGMAQIELHYFFKSAAAKSLQSCPTLCNFMDCSLPGSSVHGISQAGILKWVAISFSRGSSRPRDWTCISCIDRRILDHWANQEARKSYEAPIIISVLD